MRAQSAVCLFASLLWCSFVMASPVAMVTDVAGSVSVGESGKAQSAALLSYVEPGAVLRVASGARVALTFLSRPIEVTLSGPSEATVGNDGVTVQKGAAPAIRTLAAARSDAARNFQSAQRDRVALATVQMRSLAPPRIQIEGPANTTVSSTSPVLSWTAPEGARDTRIVVNDALGRPVVDRRVSGSSLALSESPLAYGASYTWRVESKGPSGESLSANAPFSVIDAEQATRLAASKPSSDAPFSERLLFALQLQSQGLAYEAKREWRALSAERPDDAALRQMAR